MTNRVSWARLMRARAAGRRAARAGLGVSACPYRTTAAATTSTRWLARAWLEGYTSETRSPAPVPDGA